MRGWCVEVVAHVVVATVGKGGVVRGVGVNAVCGVVVFSVGIVCVVGCRVDGVLIC